MPESRLQKTRAAYQASELHSVTMTCDKCGLPVTTWGTGNYMIAQRHLTCSITNTYEKVYDAGSAQIGTTIRLSLPKKLGECDAPGYGWEV